jgi:hypothetical protein
VDNLSNESVQLRSDNELQSQQTMTVSPTRTICDLKDESSINSGGQANPFAGEPEVDENNNLPMSPGRSKSLDLLDPRILQQKSMQQMTTSQTSLINFEYMPPFVQCQARPSESANLPNKSFMLKAV